MYSFKFSKKIIVHLRFSLPLFKLFKLFLSPQMQHCKPVAIVLLFTQQIFRLALFFNSTSSKFYNQDSPYCCIICCKNNTDWLTYSQDTIFKDDVDWLREPIHTSVELNHLFPPCSKCKEKVTLSFSSTRTLWNRLLFNYFPES